MDIKQQLNSGNRQFGFRDRSETEHARNSASPQNFAEATERCKTTTLFLQCHILAELVKTI
jgi:hypothetical protein